MVFLKLAYSTPLVSLSFKTHSKVKFQRQKPQNMFTLGEGIYLNKEG